MKKQMDWIKLLMRQNMDIGDFTIGYLEGNLDTARCFALEVLRTLHKEGLIEEVPTCLDDVSPRAVLYLLQTLAEELSLLRYAEKAMAEWRRIHDASIGTAINDATPRATTSDAMAQDVLDDSEFPRHRDR